jgi:hypothetical protein
MRAADYCTRPGGHLRPVDRVDAALYRVTDGRDCGPLIEWIRQFERSQRDAIGSSKPQVGAGGKVQLQDR